MTKNLESILITDQMWSPRFRFTLLIAHCMARNRTITKTQILRAVEAIRDAGIPVGAVEVRPDGTIIVNAVAEGKSSRSETDRWFESHETR